MDIIYCILLLLAWICNVLGQETLTINGETVPEDIILQSGQSLTLICTDRTKRRSIDWKLPNNTRYEGYSDPHTDGRNSVSSENEQDFKEITITNLNAVDTGLYECRAKTTMGIGEPGKDKPNRYHTNSVYVFVKDPANQNLLLHPNSENRLIEIRPQHPTYIPCLTTNPEAVIELLINGEPFSLQDFYNPQKGFLVTGDDLGILSEETVTKVSCSATKDGAIDRIDLELILLPQTYLHMSMNSTGAQNVYKGGKLILECSVLHVDSPFDVQIMWTLPTNEQCSTLVHKRVYCKDISTKNAAKNRLEISNDPGVRMSDQGEYSCSAKYLNKENSTNVHVSVSETKGQVSVSLNKTAINKNGVTFKTGFHVFPTQTDQSNLTWIFEHEHPIDGVISKTFPIHQAGRITIMTPFGHSSPVDGRKEVRSNLWIQKQPLATDSGNYYSRVCAADDFCENMLSFPLQANASEVKAKVTVRTADLKTTVDPRFLERGIQYALVCSGIDSPILPRIELKDDEKNLVTGTESRDGTFERAKILSFTAEKPESNFDCIVSRSEQNEEQVPMDTATIRLTVGDISDDQGMEIIEKRSTPELYQGDSATLSCKTQKTDVGKPGWRAWASDGSEINLENNKNYKLEYDDTSLYSNKLSLEMKKLSLGQSANYSCSASLDQTQISRKVEVKVNEVIPPYIDEANSSGQSVSANHSSALQLKCYGYGSPEPTITWYKDGEAFKQRPGFVFSDQKRRLTITRVAATDKGIYSCKLESRKGSVWHKMELKVAGVPALPFLSHTGLIILIVVSVLAVIAISSLCVCLVWQKKKEKAKDAELQDMYERLMRDAHGSGMSPVLKLDPARPVNQQLENLAFDRRFEIPLESIQFGDILGEGQFGKVVSGKLTSPITNVEMEVAVKMPLNGRNIDHQKILLDELKLMIYLGHHPNVLNLVGAVTKLIIKGELYVVVELCSHGSLLHYVRDRRASFLSEIATGRDERRSMQFEGYMQPVQMVMESDTTTYNSETDPNWSDQLFSNRTTNILTTSDLLSYAYQTAHGMAFLASRIVVHRDLAARNLLLTQKGIVKVADFGLAKHQPTYTVQHVDTPLPIKWMALESIMDHDFTVMSDVWSFGVAMWELFSLGIAPYPGRNMDTSFVQFLVQGNRLEHPPYAPVEMYNLMRQCWLRSPEERPSFTECRDKIGIQLKRCSPQLFESITQTLAQEDERGMHDYENYRNIEEPQMEGPDAVYINVPSAKAKYERLPTHEPIIDNQSYMIPMSN